jgi:hypothetical protein
MPTRDDATAMHAVAQALNTAGVPFYIGGSVASSAHGIGRSTYDIDIVARFEARHVHPFIQALGGDFYADDLMMLDAIRLRSSFNVIHQPTSCKVDVFADKSRAFDREAWTRLVECSPFEGVDDVYPVASPEDVMLAKLEWLRLGDETSRNQIPDVVGIIKVQGDRLDRAYLERWARELGVSDLLERAFTETGL